MESIIGSIHCVFSCVSMTPRIAQKLNIAIKTANGNTTSLTGSRGQFTSTKNGALCWTRCWSMLEFLQEKYQIKKYNNHC